MTFLNGRQILDNSIALIKLIAGGTRDSTTFLRGDGVFAVPPGGGGSASLTPVTVTLPWNKREYTVEITDASVTTASKIAVFNGIYTRTDQNDEEAEAIRTLEVVECLNGSFRLRVVSLGPIAGPFKFLYLLTA